MLGGGRSPSHLSSWAAGGPGGTAPHPTNAAANGRARGSGTAAAAHAARRARKRSGRENRLTRQVVAAVAALVGGYLLYLGANPESSFATALAGFWAGVALFVSVPACRSFIQFMLDNNWHTWIAQLVAWGEVRSVIVLLGWRVAGWWGVDRLLLPRLGAPWAPRGAAPEPRAALRR
jgi:hypothetical protein